MKKIAIYTLGSVFLLLILSSFLLPELDDGITSATTYEEDHESITGSVIKSLEGIENSTTVILFSLVVCFIYVFYLKK